MSGWAARTRRSSSCARSGRASYGPWPTAARSKRGARPTSFKLPWAPPPQRAERSLPRRRIMAQVQHRRQRTNPEVVRAYARSAAGRAMIRRELVEGAQIRPGQQALLVCETAPPGGMDEIVRVVGEVLREEGVQVTTMAVDELIPVPPGSAPGAWLHVDQLELPRPLHEAIRAADIVLDYTVNSRGAQKYNVYFHNLSMYYGKTIFARRPVEAIELLSSDPTAPVATPEALTYPS